MKTKSDLEMMASCFSCDETHAGRFGADALGNLANELKMFLEDRVDVREEGELPSGLADYLHFFMQRMQMAADVGTKMCAAEFEAKAKVAA